MRSHRTCNRQRWLVPILGIAVLALVLTACQNLGAGPGTREPGLLPAERVTLADLVLDNGLGSEAEVLGSRVGAGFTINGDSQGTVIYVPGKLGNAVATTGGTLGPTGGFLTMSHQDFYPQDRTRGTVEVWAQKRIPSLIPYQTPLINLFGHGQYFGGYWPITAYWSDGADQPPIPGLRFVIVITSPPAGPWTWHRAIDQGWNDVPVGDWVHLAFVWDFDGIDGTQDRMRIYRDGVITATNTDDIGDLAPYADPNDANSDNALLLGHHMYGRFGQPTLYLDEIKVWTVPRTDFGDYDLDGILNDVDPAPLEASKNFSDEALGGKTTGQVLGYDESQYTLEIRDADDSAKGVTVAFACLDPGTCSPDGILRLRIDRSQGTYKLALGTHHLTSGSLTLEVETGHAAVEFVLGGTTIVVEVAEGATAFIEETIVLDELVTLVLTSVGGQVSANGVVLAPGRSQQLPLPITIDIKPGSEPNCLNNDGHGVIPVAILGSADFDATTIDAATVMLEGLAVRAVGKTNKLLAHLEDVDADGFTDLVIQIEDQDGVFSAGDTTATLTGKLLPAYGGLPFEGTDTICIVP